MEGNYAVIEIKTCRTNRFGILKDLRTLSIFIGDVGYARAIFLVFGYEVDQGLFDNISAAARDLGDLPPIEFWLHAEPGRRAELIETLGGERVVGLQIGEETVN